MRSLHKYAKPLGLCFLLSTSAVSGQGLIQNLGGQRVGTTVFTFLKIEPSVYGAGLGSAAVAIPGDASGLFYNPSIISRLPQINIVATNIQWPADIRYNVFFASFPFGKNKFIGLSYGALQTEPMIETTEQLPFGTGREFIFRDQYFGVTYSQRLTDRFSAGTTVKYISETLADVNMTTVLFDFGTYYLTGFRSLRISSSFSNFGQEVAPRGSYTRIILSAVTGDEIETETKFQAFSPPTTFRLGAAYNLIEQGNQKLSLAVQLTHLADNAENYALGMNYKMGSVLTLRSGYQANTDEFSFSFGVGIKVKIGGDNFLQIDYAFTQADILTSPQRFSVGLAL